jgi:hypothetical protein
MSKLNNKPTTLAAAVSATAFRTACMTEASEQAAVKTDGYNAAAHVLPKALAMVATAQQSTNEMIRDYASAAYAAGLRLSHIACRYGTKNATPELNLMYSTVARAIQGEKSLTLISSKEAIKMDKEAERTQQVQRVSKYVGDIRAALETLDNEVAGNDSDASEESDKAAPKGAQKSRGKMIDPQLVKVTVQAMLASKIDTKEIKAAIHLLTEWLTKNEISL